MNTDLDDNSFLLDVDDDENIGFLVDIIGVDVDLDIDMDDKG